ncbi:Ribonucleotide-diphosphate reductase (RNR), small subunit, partial [Rhizina undulata]
MSSIDAISSETALKHDVASLEKSITSTEIPAAEEEAIVIKSAVEEEQDEPLLKENKNRFVLFPIKYHEIWNMYKKAEA